MGGVKRIGSEIWARDTADYDAIKRSLDLRSPTNPELESSLSSLVAVSEGF